MTISDGASMSQRGKRSCPAILISAPSSNQGKTTITAGLAYLHSMQGKNVRVFKIGPDFLDPMLLTRACRGKPVYQLDLWMMGAAECRRLLYDAACEADLIIVEGVMGLFDGKPSSADLAELFDIPVIAVINASSMAQTFGAVALGLKTLHKDLPFAGVFANGAVSTRHAEMISDGLPSNIKLLGTLFKQVEFDFPHRHLGLVQADEIDDLEAKLANVARALSSTDLNQLPPPVRFSAPRPVHRDQLLAGITIAIARDLAFSFLYPGNLDFLREAGATLTYFSPLQDKEIPACDCLYFPGGYPELFVKQLGSNVEIGNHIRKHFEADKPIYAECGGMLYVLESLTNQQGVKGKMLGLLPGTAVVGTNLKSLGYQSLDLGDGEIRGHTFHYSECSTTLEPIARGKRLHDGRSGEPIYKERNLVASYLHLYFPSNPSLSASLFRGLKMNT